MNGKYFFRIHTITFTSKKNETHTLRKQKKTYHTTNEFTHTKFPNTNKSRSESYSIDRKNRNKLSTSNRKMIFSFINEFKRFFHTLKFRRTTQYVV